MHFIGLLSDGGVHSRYDQLLACLKGVHLCRLEVCVAFACGFLTQSLPILCHA